MPISKAGKKIKRNLEEQYGKKKGEEVFYAMENKGKIPGMAKGGDLKPVPAANKGLNKLPTQVRNKMGYMNKGGMVKSTGKLNTGIRKCGE